MVAHQQLDLLAIVVGEDVGAREGGAVGAGIGQGAEGRAVIDDQILQPDGDAEIGVAGGDRGIAGALALHEALEAVVDDPAADIVDLGDGAQRRIRIGEAAEIAHAGVAAVRHDHALP